MKHVRVVPVSKVRGLLIILFQSIGEISNKTANK